MWILITALVVVAIVGFAFVFIVIKTSSVRGEAAIERMNDEELAFLGKLQQITASSTREDIERLLGPPDREGAGLRPSWKAPGGSSNSQAAVYFMGDRPRMVRWMKIGHFVWEEKLG